MEAFKSILIGTFSEIQVGQSFYLGGTGTPMVKLSTTHAQQTVPDLCGFDFQDACTPASRELSPDRRVYIEKPANRPNTPTAN
jgi:hypothetical protein